MIAIICSRRARRSTTANELNFDMIAVSPCRTAANAFFISDVTQVWNPALRTRVERICRVRPWFSDSPRKTVFWAGGQRRRVIATTGWLVERPSTYNGWDLQVVLRCSLSGGRHTAQRKHDGHARIEPPTKTCTDSECDFIGQTFVLSTSSALATCFQRWTISSYMHGPTASRNALNSIACASSARGVASLHSLIVPFCSQSSSSSAEER